MKRGRWGRGRFRLAAGFRGRCAFSVRMPRTGAFINVRMPDVGAETRARQYGHPCHKPAVVAFKIVRAPALPIRTAPQQRGRMIGGGCVRSGATQMSIMQTVLQSSHFMVINHVCQRPRVDCGGRNPTSLRVSSSPAAVRSRCTLAATRFSHAPARRFCCRSTSSTASRIRTSKAATAAPMSGSTRPCSRRSASLARRHRLAANSATTCSFRKPMWKCCSGCVMTVTTRRRMPKRCCWIRSPA